MKSVIILSGKSGSGKDMTAHFMKEQLEQDGNRVIMPHYADAVKWVLHDYFGWNGEKDEYGRGLLQRIGTDVVRVKFPNFWAGIVAGLIDAFENEFDVAIIPDARFENEIDVVANTVPNVTCVRIERKNPDGSDWVNSLLTEKQRQHPSETSLDVYAFDYVIHNDEGLELLKESAKTILVDMKLVEGEIIYE